MRFSYISLVLAVALAACSRTPEPVVVNPGVPAGQQQVVVQPQVADPNYQQPQVVAQPQPQVVYQQPQVVAQPQVVYAQPQQTDHSGTALVAGAALGYALGSANQPQTTTVVRERTIYRDPYAGYTRDSAGRWHDSTGRFAAAPPAAAPLPAANRVDVNAAPPPAPAVKVAAAPTAVKVAAAVPTPAPKPAPAVVKAAPPAPTPKKK